MATEYYGGAPNAFLGGEEFGAARRDRIRRQNALAALIEQYGPAAADPQSMALLQSVEQREELHPFEVAAAERERAAQEALVQQHGAIAGNAETQKRDLALRMSAGKRAAQVLSTVKNRKGDLGRAFDFVQTALPALGISPEHLATIRNAIVSNPDNVDEFVALLQDPEAQKALSGGQPFYDDATGKLFWGVPTETGFRRIEGATPALAFQAGERVRQGDERLRLGWQNLDWDKIKELLPQRAEGVQSFMMPDGRVVADVVPGSPAEQKLFEKLDELDAGDRKFLRTFDSVSEHARVVATNAGRALNLMNDGWIQGQGVLSSNARVLAAKVPGTDSFDIRDALEAMKNNISVDELQRMRSNSPTGGALGNVTEREMGILSGALGRLEIERDPVKLREDLNDVLKIYERIVDAAEEDAQRAEYRSQLRSDRRRSSFGPQPRPRPGASTAPAAGAPDVRNMTDEELARILSGGQ